MKTGDKTQQTMMEKCLNNQNPMFDIVLIAGINEVSRMSIFTDRDPVLELIFVKQNDKEEWVDYKVTMQFSGDMERQKFSGDILEVKEQLRNEEDEDDDEDIKEEEAQREGDDSNEEGAENTSLAVANIKEEEQNPMLYD